MTVINSKFIISISLVGLILLVLYIMGRKSVHTELMIPAEAGEIWAVLMDAAGYSEWNPVLVPVEGELREGANIKYEMTQPDGKQSSISARVVELIKEKKLNQFGGMPGILTFDHTYSLEPVEDGTKVTQHEEYRGIGVVFWDAGWVEPAYAKINKALRERVALVKMSGEK